jgi:hypothetical protein
VGGIAGAGSVEVGSVAVEAQPLELAA